MKTMKMILLTLALTLASVEVNAQEIYNEVKRMQKQFETVKLDKTKKMDERKIASFKWDAIEYMLYKAKQDSTFTELQLGKQTNAMVDFVNIFIKRLVEAGNSKNKSKREAVALRFKNASINHSLFHDEDKDLALAYYDNPKFITQFSLDTDWVEALKEIREMDWK